MENNSNSKMKGALLAFVILQLCYLFFFFISFPDSFRNAVETHYGALDTIASWLSSLTMLGYCITCLASVAQLAMRKPGFLLWFQISGAIALGGNFIVYILRQISGDWYYSYSFDGGDFYWILFIMALFWTVIWCIYFARSSRVFSYMGDATYLKMALFTKNVREPAPWVEPKPFYPATYSQPYMPPQTVQPQPPQPVPGYPPYAPPYAPPVQQAPPMPPAPPMHVVQPGYYVPPAPPPPQEPPMMQPQQQPGYAPPPAPAPQAWPPLYSPGPEAQPGSDSTQYPNQ